MAFYSSLKTVMFPTISSADDLDHDRSRAYNVYVDQRPTSAFQALAVEGDLYVCMCEDTWQNTVHVFRQGTWVEWDPSMLLTVSMAGIDAHPVLCETQGLRYVVTTDEGFQLAPETMQDMTSLAELIALDVAYPGLGKKSCKRPVSDAAIGPSTGPKRSCTDSRNMMQEPATTSARAMEKRRVVVQDPELEKMGKGKEVEVEVEMEMEIGKRKGKGKGKGKGKAEAKTTDKAKVKAMDKGKGRDVSVSEHSTSGHIQHHMSMPDVVIGDIQPLMAPEGSREEGTSTDILEPEDMMVDIKPSIAAQGLMDMEINVSAPPQVMLEDEDEDFIHHRECH